MAIRWKTAWGCLNYSPDMDWGTSQTKCSWRQITQTERQKNKKIFKLPFFHTNTKIIQPCWVYKNESSNDKNLIYDENVSHNISE